MIYFDNSVIVQVCLEVFVIYKQVFEKIWGNFSFLYKFGEMVWNLLE